MYVAEIFSAPRKRKKLQHDIMYSSLFEFDDIRKVTVDDEASGKAKP